MTMRSTPEARHVDRTDERNGKPDELLELAERIAGDPARRVEVLHKLLGEAACRNIGIYPIPPGFKLSVVIPVYNEERWLAELVRRVQAVQIPKELILVDDCSTDGTPAILAQARTAVRQRPRVPSAAEHGQGRGAPRRLQALHRRRRHRAGRRLGIRPGRVPEAHSADPRRPGRRRLRLAVHRREPPRAVLLALGRQQGADDCCRTGSPT